MTDKHPDAGVEAAIKVVESYRNRFRSEGLHSSPFTVLCEQIISRLRALPAQQTDVSGLEDYSKEGEALAIKHGFTAAQYKAAKMIEYRIFGPYQWQDQRDRASSMFVQIMQAMKDNEEALALPAQQHQYERNDPANDEANQ